MDKRDIEKLKQQLAELRSEHENWMEKISRVERDLDQLAIQELTDPVESGTPHQANLDAPQRVASRIDNESTDGNNDHIRTEDINAHIPPSHSEPGVSTAKNLEFRIGGTWLNRIGVVAVIIGIALFLKYSIDNEWIGPTGRVLLGIVAGIAMLVTGEKLRGRYPGYAQGLLGGGSLAIFFAVYASYGFYHLIAPVYAFIFLVLVMVNTVFMAIRHRALAIGILGIVGGYAIPIIIGSDQPSLWILFSYLSLLTTGVLAVSIYQKWASFQYLSFVFNQLIFGGVWITHFLFNNGSKYVAPSLAFLIFTFALYLAVATVYNIRTKHRATRLDISLILLNAFAFFAWSLAVLDNTWVRDYTGFYAVFLALIYIFLGRWAYRLFREDQGQVFSLFAVSFVLITISIPLQLDVAYVALAWLAEAVAIAYIARQTGNAQLSLSGFIVLLLGWAVTLNSLVELVEYPRDFFVFLTNSATLQWLASIAATVLFILLSHPVVRLKQIAIPIHTIAKAAILAWIFVGITLQNTHFFMLKNYNYFLSPEQLSLSALWILYAVSVFMVGMKKNNRYLRYAALGLFAIVIFKAFFVDLAQLAAIFRILLFIVLGLALLGVSYWYQKKKHVFQDREGL